MALSTTVAPVHTLVQPQAAAHLCHLSTCHKAWDCLPTRWRLISSSHDPGPFVKILKRIPCAPRDLVTKEFTSVIELVAANPNSLPAWDHLFRFSSRCLQYLNEVADGATWPESLTSTLGQNLSPHPHPHPYHFPKPAVPFPALLPRWQEGTSQMPWEHQSWHPLSFQLTANLHPFSGGTHPTCRQREYNRGILWDSYFLSHHPQAYFSAGLWPLPLLPRQWDSWWQPWTGAPGPSPGGGSLWVTLQALGPLFKISWSPWGSWGADSSSSIPRTPSSYSATPLRSQNCPTHCGLPPASCPQSSKPTMGCWGQSPATSPISLSKTQIQPGPRPRSLSSMVTSESRVQYSLPPQPAYVASAAGSSDLVSQIIPRHLQQAPLVARADALSSWYLGHNTPTPTDSASHSQREWDSQESRLQTSSY